MKNKFYILAGLSLVLMFSSCTKDEIIVDTASKSNLKSGEVNECYTTFQEAFGTTRWGCVGEYCIDQPTGFSLIGGQHIDVGNVSMENDAVNLYVTFKATGGWMLQEIHLYVGSFEGVPTNKKNTPVPGKFPYKEEGLNDESFTIEIPLSEIGSGCFTVLTHAVVIKDGKDETAWGCGDCEEDKYLTLKLWTVDRWFAILTSGVKMYEGFWCADLGVVKPEDGSNYEIETPWLPGVVFAYAHINMSEDQLIVSIIPTDDNIQLETTHLFYGTSGQLEAYLDGDCPAYYNFPYYDSLPGPTHEIIIPL